MAAIRHVSQLWFSNGAIICVGAHLLPIGLPDRPRPATTTQTVAYRFRLFIQASLYLHFSGEE